MNTHSNTLRPGSTIYDLLDVIEQNTVQAIMDLHGRDEATVRRWIDSGGHTAKLARQLHRHGVNALIRVGLDPALLGR